MNNIRKPPHSQNTSGKKDNKNTKQDAKAEKDYEKAFDDIDDDYDDGGSSEADVDSEGDAGEEHTTRMTHHGRVITRSKKKINRHALLKKQQREALARQAAGGGNSQRNVGVKRTRLRNDNDDYDDSDDFINDGTGHDIDLGDFSGGGSHDDDQQGESEQTAQEWGDHTAHIENENRTGFDMNMVSQPNKDAIRFFQDFIQKRNDDIQKNECERLKKMLEAMFQQCIKGLHHFPKESRKHQSLGKSANICKHALSALARKNIDDVKKLVSIITPRKR